jgi:hypothetical protein
MTDAMSTIIAATTSQPTAPATPLMNSRTSSCMIRPTRSPVQQRTLSSWLLAGGARSRGALEDQRHEPKYRSLCAAVSFDHLVGAGEQA